MEIIQGSSHVSFPIEDPSRVGEARRHAIGLAAELGFDQTSSGRVALIATELGTNLIKHARQGRLLIATREGANAEIEILSIDAGPGIPSIDQSMRDGYSTGSSPGTGLGAIQRLADDFDIHSDMALGTVVVARVRPKPAAPTPPRQFSVGVVALCAPGETMCGDGWGVALEGDEAAVLMADGLGHGPEAFAAAQAAIQQFLQKPFAPLSSTLELAHAGLRRTRGAAVAAGVFNAQLSTIRSAGAGNIITRVVSGVTNRTLLSQHGTIGIEIRRTEEIASDWPAHALVVMHSDGLISRWAPEVLHGVIGRDPSIAAAILLRDYFRGRDDVTVLVLRRKD